MRTRLRHAWFTAELRTPMHPLPCRQRPLKPRRRAAYLVCAQEDTSGGRRRLRRVAAAMGVVRTRPSARNRRAPACGAFCGRIATMFLRDTILLSPMCSMPTPLSDVQVQYSTGVRRLARRRRRKRKRRAAGLKRRGVSPAVPKAHGKRAPAEKPSLPGAGLSMKWARICGDGGRGRGPFPCHAQRRRARRQERLQAAFAVMFRRALCAQENGVFSPSGCTGSLTSDRPSTGLCRRSEGRLCHPLVGCSSGLG